jgi:hypothetical protein
MRTSLMAAVVCVILAFPGSCQTPAKNWKDRAEYDLYRRIASESSVGEKMKLLLEWRRMYPASDFTLVRQSLFLRAYDSAGQGDEAFAAASELLQRDPSDVTAMLLLCYWAPRLKAPPEGAAGLVKKAATGVLAQLDQVLPTSFARRDMGSFFDSLETGKPPRTEQVSSEARKEQRAKAEQVARQALDRANGR